MVYMILTAIFILAALLAIAAVWPHLVKKAAGWLIAAGVVFNGWLNSDFIPGLF